MLTFFDIFSEKMNPDEKSSMKELEGWIEQLMECKQLSENQVNSRFNWIFRIGNPPLLSLVCLYFTL